MKKEPKCTKVYISKWEAPWGAARAERPQRGVRKGQTLAADLSAPLSAASLGGAGGLPNGNTPLRTRTERPKAGLALCAGGWARWAKRTQRASSEQWKSKGRASSEQQYGKPPGGLHGQRERREGERKGQTLAADLSAPPLCALSGGAGGLPRRPPVQGSGERQ